MSVTPSEQDEAKGVSEEGYELKKNLELPADYIFSVKDAPDNIAFVALDDSTDVHPQIRAATLPKLVERLSYTEYVGKCFGKNWM